MYVLIVIQLYLHYILETRRYILENNLIVITSVLGCLLIISATGVIIWYCKKVMIRYHPELKPNDGFKVSINVYINIYI